MLPADQIKVPRSYFRAMIKCKSVAQIMLDFLRTSSRRVQVN